ncbi:hypothetical protein RFF05_11885 [Bengtsoniella intestinalis]|uniref:hypothetical protein n=1 Tax=Bengtsoniella intestinalis TaxID=3073143 RepID=UPI00391FA90A
MFKKLDIGRSSIAFAVLIVVVVGLVIANSLQRTTYITLPTDTADAEQTTTNPDDAVNAVAVTTDTVQDIIASLSHSDYRRTVRIEQLWSGGSGSRDITVTQVGGNQRIDEVLADGRTQHTVSAQDILYVWFDEELPIYQSPVGAFTADQLQGIPTYEDVIGLPVGSISDAGYESLSGVRCIYVETVTDSDGYQSRYWISVDSGLLVAAERLEHDITIYRMAVVSEETIADENTYFVLPDGLDVTD